MELGCRCFRFIGNSGPTQHLRSLRPWYLLIKFWLNCPMSGTLLRTSLPNTFPSHQGNMHADSRRPNWCHQGMFFDILRGSPWTQMRAEALSKLAVKFGKVYIRHVSSAGAHRWSSCSTDCLRGSLNFHIPDHRQESTANGSCMNCQSSIYCQS